MPEIIDGNVIDLVEAEIDFAQCMKFRGSCEVLHAAFLDLQRFHLWKHLGEISRQISYRCVPHNDTNHAFIGTIPIIVVSLVKMFADNLCDIRETIGVGEVHDLACVTVVTTKLKIAGQFHRENCINH